MHENSPSNKALFRVIHAGAMTSLQDGGRHGLKSYGIPPGGAMDLGALERLNRLFDQPKHRAAWEMLWASLSLQCLEDCWIAFSGDAMGFLDESPIAPERTIHVQCNQTLRFQARGQSLWTYLAVAGAWSGPAWFGSQSVWPEGGMGSWLKDGDLLESTETTPWQLPSFVAARLNPPHAIVEQAPFRVSPGPQWDDFSEPARAQFMQCEWRISPQSNRAGFRLQGPVLNVPSYELISEPTIVGSIQVPANGQAIVLLNDGPTIGGYAKIAVIHAEDLDRFRQLPPGRTIQFALLS